MKFLSDLLVQGDGNEIFLKSADHNISRIIPRGTGANLDKGLFSLFDTGTEDVRIDTAGVSWFNGGNIGIGTASPSYKLHVQGSNNGNINTTVENTNTGTNAYATYRLKNNSINTAALFLNGSNNTAYSGANSLNMYQGGNHPLGFVTSNQTRMTVTGDGNVGIGTTSPGAKLDVAGSAPVIRLTDTRSLNVGDWDDVSLGKIQFYTSDTTSPGARALAEVEAYSGAAAASGPEAELRFKTSDINDASPVQRMVIDAQGRVGIGTTSPGDKLDVSGNVKSTGLKLAVNTSMYTEDATLSYYSASNAVYLNGAGNDGWLRLNASGASNDSVAINLFGTSAGNYQTFKTNSAERMRIDSSGNVGIGTTNPTEKLAVDGNIETTQPVGKIGFNVGDAYGDFPHYGLGKSNGANPVNLSGYYGLTFGSNGAERMRITSDGNVGIGTTNPYSNLWVSGLGINAASELTTTDTTSNAILALAGTNSLVRLQMGTMDVSPWGGWIQASYDNTSEGGTNGVAPLLLNPLGGSAGNVGIGTTSPNEKLTVAGNIHAYAPSGINAGLFASTAAGATSIAIRSSGVTFFNAGNVGIGTTSPVQKLDVSGAIKASSYVYTNELRANADSGSRIVIHDGGGNIEFKTQGGTERMTIAYGGNVGIGTASPGQKLDVSGNIAVRNTNKIFFNHNTDTSRYIGASSTNDLDIASNDDLNLRSNYNRFWNGSTEFARLSGSANSWIANGSNGKLGIGTTSPQSQLHIYKSNSGGIGGELRLDNNNAAVGNKTRILFSDGGGGSASFDRAAIVAQTEASPYKGQLQFQTGYTTLTTKMIITGDGNVGIGTTSPNAKLQVSGNSVFEEDIFALQNKGIFFNGLNDFSSGIAGIDSGTSVRIFAGGSEKVRVKSTGNVGIGTASPSQKLEVNGNIKIGDAQKSLYGTGDDLQIYHDGSNSYISDTGTGDLYLLASDNVYFQTHGSGKRWITLNENASVDLFYNDSKKLETTSTGVAVTGKITNLTAGTGNLDAVNVQQLNNATTGALIYKGTWSAAPTTTSVLDGAVSSAGTIVIDAPNPGISVGATITGTGISGTVTVSNIAADGITIAISSPQTIANGTTLTFTTVGGTPDLSQASRKVTGHYYICETAGAVTPNGAGTTPNEWAVGDWVTFSDLTTDAWQKIDNSSVLSGAGTGGKVPVWSGSGTSVTLADAPITVSGSNATFAGDVLVEDNLYLTDAGTVRGKIQLNSSDRDNLDIKATSLGSLMRFYTVDTLALTLDSSQNATFAGDVDAAGNVEARGYLQAFSTFYMRGTTQIMNKTADGFLNFLARDTSGSEAVMNISNVGTLSTSGNATFAGDITQADGKRIWFRDSSASSGTGAQSYVFSDGLNLKIKGDDNVQILGDGGGIIAHFDYTSKVGIGTTVPKSMLHVAGGIQMSNDTAAASADKVGTMRYRTDTEYVEVNGTELVTNGDFATDSDWTKEAGWSIASGKASYDASSATNALYQNIGLTTGSVYKLSFTVVDYTSGSFKAHLSNGNVSAATDAISANGDYSFNITATGALVLFRNVTSFNGSIDNVSVIEVTAEDASYADMCMQTGASTYEWVNIVRNTY